MATVSLNTFRQADADATRIRLQGADALAVASGQTTGGRIVARLGEVFGAGKEANRDAIRTLTSSIRAELGADAEAHAKASLNSRLINGKPLSARTARRVIGEAETTLRRKQSEKLKQVSESYRSPAAEIIAEVAEAGGISHDTALQLITNDAIRSRLDRQAETTLPQSGTSQPFGIPSRGPVIQPTDQTLIRGEFLAGGGEADRNAAGQVSTKGAVHQSGEADPRAVITSAVKEYARKLEEANQTAAALFAFDPKGKSSRATDGMKRTLGGYGINVGSSIDAMPGSFWKASQDSTARTILLNLISDSEPRMTHVQTEAAASMNALRQFMSHLSKNLVHVEPKSGVGAFQNFDAKRLLSGKDAEVKDFFDATHQGWKDMLDASENGGNLFTAQQSYLDAIVRTVPPLLQLNGRETQEDLQKIDKLMFWLGMNDQLLVSKLDEKQKATVLDGMSALREAMYKAARPKREQELGADITTASDRNVWRQAAMQGWINRETAVKNLADVVSLQVDELKSHYDFNEADALHWLRVGAPDLIERMDRLLADGGEHPMPGAWLDRRIELAKLRADTKKLAEDPTVGGNDIQRFISVGMREIQTKMFGSAARVLAGTPPEHYTVLNLGSTARGEGSPFSDVEFGILLRDNYSMEDWKGALTLTGLVREQIMALGESSDLVRATGFHWDTENNPINNPERVVGSKQELLDHALGSAVKDDVYPTLFTTVEHLFGPEMVGDAVDRLEEPKESWEALQEFHGDTEQYLRITRYGDQTNGEHWGKVLIDSLPALLQTAQPNGDDSDTVDVKQLGRIPMLLAQGYALQNGIILDESGQATNTTHTRLVELVRLNLMTQKDADEIVDLQDRISAARVRLQAATGSANNTVSTDPAGPRQGASMHMPDVAALLRRAEILVARRDADLIRPSSAS